MELTSKIGPDLKLFEFGSRDSKGILKVQRILAYNLEDAIVQLPKEKWVVLGNIAIKDIINNVSFIIPPNLHEPDKIETTLEEKKLSLANFFASLKLASEKFSETLTSTDKTALKRIIKKFEQYASVQNDLPTS